MPAPKKKNLLEAYGLGNAVREAANSVKASLEAPPGTAPAPSGPCPDDSAAESREFATLLSQASPLRSQHQRALYRYLSKSGSLITTSEALARAARVPVRSVFRILKKFEDMGWIKREPYIDGATRGVRLIVTLPEDPGC